MSSFTLKTTHGLISITDNSLKNDKPALLLIHGNSCSSKIWQHFFDSEMISQNHRIVAFDLPGHGASSNAPDPEKTYCQRGYAELAVYILEHLNIASVVVLGWSLGGHIGIEMVPLLKPTTSQAHPIELKGLMLVGTPPSLGKEQIASGFKFGDGGLGHANMENWTDEQTIAFARNCAAARKEECYEEWMLADAKRTDGRARIMMGNVFAGTEDAGPVGVDQVKVVETEDVLVAVVNGSKDQFVNLDYLDNIKWRKLWRAECIRLDGLGHAPFWEEPASFETILMDFLADCAKEE
ncbi:alpha/beta-hydrolase [Clathrospora elynae]|uniref:Alpha/beta-hydrolase n=1 Tax=Clathrospora elynae TaxID=706981 RepID=A0A6A5SLS6_9PLEO|nr:alpha/beta-hydrolase [Clathrospora elynae]